VRRKLTKSKKAITDSGAIVFSAQRSLRIEVESEKNCPRSKFSLALARD
jgi:hypothetical protein